jgi:hypothetical protein
MAIYIRTAGSGVQQTSIELVIDGLGNQASTYTTALWIKNNTTGETIDIRGTGGGGSPYYSMVANFTGLTAGTTYSFSAFAQTNSGGASGSASGSWTTDSPPPVPSMPSVYLLSVSGRTITWRITAGANTNTIYIDRTWSTETSTAVSSGQSFDWSHTGSSDGTQYGIRVRGRNSYSYTNYTGWSYGTTEAPAIVVGSVSNVLASAVTTSSFTLSWGAASNATTYQIRNRIQGTTSWQNYYSTSTSVTISGLQTETYYEVQVRGYAGSSYGGYSNVLLIRTQSLVPTPLNWQTFDTSSPQGALTAKNWNDMTSKVNAWLTYFKKSNYTFTVASTGDELTAVMFNQAVTELKRMSPPTVAPSTVSSATTGLSARLNQLGNSIDSLT